MHNSQIFYKGFVFLIILSLFSSCRDFKKQHKNRFENSGVRFVVPEVMVKDLPGEVRETSGLFLYDGLIWTINDSGGLNTLYGLDPETGSVVRRVSVKNAENRDWETLAANEEYVFIGDVGNNRGNRKDLTIYRVRKADLSGTAKKVKSESIFFAWPDQRKFTPGIRETRYDCEAMISWKDSLMLFTKDWKNKNTALYILSAEPGPQQAFLLDSLEAGVLITGADLSPDGKTLVLTAYYDFDPYFLVFSDFHKNRFFEGNKTRYVYPSFHNAQTEGVVFKGNDTLLISAERSGRLDAAIYLFLRPQWATAE